MGVVAFLALAANLTSVETYVIPEPFGSRRIILNGAAARLGAVGDRIIIMSFAWVAEEDVREGRHRPRVLCLDERNEPLQRIPTAPTTEEIAPVTKTFLIAGDWAISVSFSRREFAGRNPTDAPDSGKDASFQKQSPGR